MMSRRAFALGMVSTIPLAGCAVARVGKTTTYTLQIQKFCKYSELVYEFAEASIGLSFVASAIGAPEVAIIIAALASAAAATKALASASGGKLVVVIDKTSTKTEIDSIVTDLSNAATLVANVIIGTTSTIAYPILTQAQKAAKSALLVLTALSTLLTTSSSVSAVYSGVSKKDIENIRVFVSGVKDRG